jgi:hypothetical protein
MQTPMYVEVWDIMVCNLDVPDPKKHEQPPDVVRERLWRLSDSCQHIVDRRERHRHSRARTHVYAHPHTCMYTDTW